jgi:FAD/FMN-containing dehydrogenase
MATFDEKIRGRNDVAMAYGRMCVTPTHFLDHAIINVLHVDPAADGALPALEAADTSSLRRSMFRGSVGDDYGKELRWTAEARLQPHLNNTHFSRNQLLNEGVEIFQNRSSSSTDILHEYFVPRDGIPKFIQAVQRIVPEHQGDLLNVTVRYVAEDRDTFLRYADREMFAFVMLFNQPTSSAGDAAMEVMTRELIDDALAAGGRYYLPYRLHASLEQFQQAYPQATEFFARKRHYDPDEIFQNRFYQKYGQVGRSID